jgi:hypothetical protein
VYELGVAFEYEETSNELCVLQGIWLSESHLLHLFILSGPSEALASSSVALNRLVGVRFLAGVTLEFHFIE